MLWLKAFSIVFELRYAQEILMQVHDEFDRVKAEKLYEELVRPS